MISDKSDAAIRDGGSFRDPSGYVFFRGENVYRTVNPSAEATFKSVAKSGLIEELAGEKLLLPTEISPADAGDPGQFRGARGEMPALVLKHPRIPFISYPYEWNFSQMRDAALAHLDLQLRAFDRGFVLSDATAYNMQFYQGKLLHIDVLSLRPYVEGEPWSGYNQFCRTFLLPLLIEAWCGMPFQPLMRGRIEGISFADAVTILPALKLWTSLNGIMHVALQARIIASASSASKGKGQTDFKLAPARYKAILQEMRNWIGRLKSGRKVSSYWNSYAEVNSYSNDMRRVKEEFVSKWAPAVKNGVIWDIGGNTGDYSKCVLDAGAEQSIVFDSDLDSLEKAYQRSKQGLRVLPLLVDIADPSPSLGWRQAERRGLNERSKPAGILALAVIHHLAIGRNLPFSDVIDWFVDTAPDGIIEFVPKSDPMVAQMLANREDVFHDYDEAHFFAYLEARAIVTARHRFGENGRVVVSYRRRV